MATWPWAPGRLKPLVGPGATSGLGSPPFAPELSPEPRDSAYLPLFEPAQPPPGTPAPTANLLLSELDYTSQTALRLSPAEPRLPRAFLRGSTVHALLRATTLPYYNSHHAPRHPGRCVDHRPLPVGDVVPLCWARGGRSET